MLRSIVTGISDMDSVELLKWTSGKIHHSIPKTIPGRKFFMDLMPDLCVERFKLKGRSLGGVKWIWTPLRWRPSHPIGRNTC